MTTQSNKSLRDYTMKADISQHHERIIRNLFNALFVSEHQHSVKTDHTPSHPTMLTLDIYQVQQLIQSHCGKLITRMEIIDALYDLAEPTLLQPSTIAFNSEIDGMRIDAIRLDYALADDSERPKYKTTLTDRDTIQSLRAVIIEMAETLHIADPNARISMTSSDILDLMHSQNDISDNAF